MLPVVEHTRPSVRQLTNSPMYRRPTLLQDVYAANAAYRLSLLVITVSVLYGECW